MDFAPSFPPLWNVHNEAITGYVCVPQRLAFSHMPAETVTFRDLTPKECVSVELACIDHGFSTLGRYLARDVRFLMICRLTFESLASPSGRMAFADVCRKLPPDLRSYLVFELTDAPMGVPQNRLGEIIMLMKPYAKAIVAQVPNGSQSYAAYQGVGLMGLGFNMEQQQPPAQIAGQVNKLCAAAKRLSFYTFLSGVDDLAGLRIARKAGAFLDRRCRRRGSASATRDGTVDLA
jgi:hypothetical protein